MSPRLSDHAAGALLVVLAAFNQLVPKYVISMGLLLAGEAGAELVWRQGRAQALLVSISVELAVGMLMPIGVPLRWAAASLLLRTALVAVNVFWAFGALQGASAYTPRVAFWMSVSFGRKSRMKLHKHK